MPTNVQTETDDNDRERNPESLTIREPDDWHLHLRDDDMLSLTADFSARQFARAIIMPNLVPPGDDRCCRGGLSRSHPRRSAARSQLYAVDDRLFDG